MNYRHITTILAGLTVCAPLVSQAQNNPNTYKLKAAQFMQQGKWADALAQLNDAIRIYGPRIEMLGLSDFGWIYYQKGFCLLQTVDSEGRPNYKAAWDAFDECYSNKLFQDPTKNEFKNVALSKMGECEFFMKEYDRALETLGKFMKMPRKSGPERNVNIGQVYCIMAQCQFLKPKPDFTEGMKALALCAENKDKGKGIPDNMIAQCFLDMTQAAITENKPEMVTEFLRKYRGIIDLGGTRLAPFAGNIMNAAVKSATIARELATEGKEKASNLYGNLTMELFGLLPNVKEVIAAANTSLAKLGSLRGVVDNGNTISKAQLEAIVKSFKTLEKDHKLLEGFATQSLASLHLSNMSARTGMAAFKLMEEQYSQMEGLEDTLYQIIMLCWQLGYTDEGSARVVAHIQKYPDSQYASTLNTLSLEKLLKEQKYEECLEQAKKVMELLKGDQKNPFYILASYCQSVSEYYLKQYPEAIKSLESFIKDNPKSEYTQQATYFIASSYTNMHKFSEAVKAFDTYIKAYPEIANNALMPTVRYEQAYALSQIPDDKTALARALENMRFIIKNYPETPLLPNALVFAGNLLAVEAENLAEAMELFQRAYDIAIKVPNKRVAAEALYSLAVQSSSAKDKGLQAKTPSYYELFWTTSDEEGNPFALQMGVLGLDIYPDDEAKFDQARERLATLIVRESNKNPQNFLIEGSVGSYTKAYLERMKKRGKELNIDQVREHFYKFPGVADKDITLRAILRMAVIGQYESAKKALKGDQHAEAVASIDGNISALFGELKSAFKPEELSPFTLLKVGNYVAASNKPEEAIPYFQELIKRQGSHVSEAIFGKATALGRSKDPAKLAEAITIMQDELKKEKAKPRPDKKVLQTAQFNLIGFLIDKGDFTAAIQEGTDYLDTSKKYNYKRPEAINMLAEACYKAGKKDDALVNYMNLYNQHMGLVRLSGPACLRIMDILWERNTPKSAKPSDHHFAWTFGSNFVKKLKPAEKKMTADDRDKLRAVEDLVKKFGSDTGVQQEEKERRQREAMIRESQGK